MQKLDILDRKILMEFDQDSRQPFSIIAKKVRASRTVVEYRVKKLIENNIITSLSAFVDPAKFGLTSWKVYLQFHNKSKEIDETITQFLQEEKRVWWVIKCEGNFDLMFLVLTKSVHEFYEFLSNFQSKFSKHEARIEITTHINPDFFSRGYLLDKESKKVCPTFLKEPTFEKLDKTDIEILKIIIKNSRTPSTEIATKLKTTARIVNYRIKDLLKRNIITHFRLIPNVNKIGMDYYKVMIKLKDLTKDKEKRLKTFLELHPNIINYSNSWGPWEIEFETEIESYKKLTELINNIRNEFSEIIKKIEFVLIYEELKATNDFLDYMHYQ
ncbi:Lrp/AsnC family transcriptional regulator [Candidatus Woesearchaeota archaeon]|nr:Lrp/AsnC family transcriptional regulator [Candidatus Woesearchaeota archaeon]